MQPTSGLIAWMPPPHRGGIRMVATGAEGFRPREPVGHGNTTMLSLLLAAAILVLWFGIDFAYALLMKRRYARWEAGIERDPDGVRRGCREYTVGNGDTAVLFVHGFADAPTVYQRMAPALAEKGFTCRV